MLGYRGVPFYGPCLSNANIRIMSNPLENKIKSLEKSIKDITNKAPRAVGSVASRHFRENFTKQGFDDNGVRKWVKRKNERSKDKGRAILVQTGRLQRSIRVRSANTQEVIIGTSVPYARYHNEGGIMHRKPHGRRTGIYHIKTQMERKKQIRRADYRLPRRQFMGASANLNRKIDTWYKGQLDRAIKKMQSVK